jgi:glycosyltransferase involved in cell wall biosynthesis
MSHIAIDARIINSSTGRYVERLLTYLEKIDHKNNYTILVPSIDIEYWQPTSDNFKLVDCNYKNYSLGEQFGFRRQLKKLDADLVHFCMPQQPIWYRHPKVTTVHDLILFHTYLSEKNWLVFRLTQLVGRVVFKSVGKRSETVITPSQYTQRAFQKFAHLPAEKVQVVYNAADAVSSRERAYKLPFKRFLLYVGSQTDYKNIKRLIDAHKQVQDTHDPNLGLVLVGRKGYYTDKNEAHAEKIGNRNVVFTGFLPDDQLAWLYKNTAAYVFPSMMEGFGLPALEAMQYGAPVISSHNTCLPEVYRNAALYFDPENTDDMAEKIITVLSDKKLADSLSKSGKSRVQEFSWRACAEQTHAIYKQALKSHKK